MNPVGYLDQAKVSIRRSPPAPTHGRGLPTPESKPGTIDFHLPPTPESNLKGWFMIGLGARLEL